MKAMLTDPVESPSQTFLLSLLNGMVDPVFVKDRQHRWVFVNDAFCAFTGYSREAMIGQSGYAFFQKAAAEGLRNQDEQVFATGGATESEEILTTAAGQSFVISTHKNVFYDQTGAAFLSVVIRSIASKSQIEAELQESKQLLRLVIDNIPQLIFWKDRNSVYLGCNQNYAKAAGIGSPDQIVGKTDYDLPWGREATEAYQARDRQIMETDTAVYGILVSRQQAGKQTWAELNKIPLHNADGQVIGILGTYEDITERKQAEETLRQSEATNRALIEAIPDLLIRMAEDGTYLDLAFEGSFKPLAIGATSGKNVSDVMPPNIVEQRLHYTRQALATGKLQLHEQELMINGQLVYEEVRVVPSGDREVLVMIRDVTDRKRAEMALQQLNESLEQKIEERTQQLRQAILQLEQEICDRKQAKVQLQEQEQFLRSIYEGIENQIFVADVLPDGDFRYVGWNRFTEEKLGILSADAVGKTPEEIFGLTEGRQIRQKYEQCLQTKALIYYEECLTFRDQKMWFITTLQPLKKATGQIYRLVGTTFNITDRKQAETALQQSETQLRQQAQALQQTLKELQDTQIQLVQSEKMSSLGQLVAGVAHEINNPVSFIYGNLRHADQYTQGLLALLHLYQQHYPDPLLPIQKVSEAIDLEFLVEDLPKLLNSMKVGAERIQAIVASLRTFSRMDEAEMKAVDIHECIDSTLMILQSQLKEQPDRAKIEVIKDYSALPLVECYAGQLNQVFMNILGNAIDALEETVATQPNLIPSIIISTKIVEGGGLRIQIADNGLGISEEKKAKIFDPFFTTKPIGKGTGMGLSISYQIVTEKHGGKLWCDSVPGKGTQFTVEIPIHQPLCPEM